MPRHNRTSFLAFGLLPLLNFVALLLHGLNLATHGRGGAAASLPLLVVLAALTLLLLPWAAVKRGRDLGWPAGLSLAASVGSLLVVPMVLVLVAYLAFAKGQESNAFGPPPASPTFAGWTAAVVLLALPWVVLAFAARILA